MVLPHGFWRDRCGSRRFPRATHARKAFDIERRGLQAWVQWEERTWGWVLAIRPASSGFIHLSPGSTVRKCLRDHGDYHLTVAYSNSLPAIERDDPASRFNSVRNSFWYPRRAHLQISWVDHASSVASVSWQDSTMGPVGHDLYFLRTRYGGHHGRLTISM